MTWGSEFPKPICLIENCGKPIHARGLCSLHYERTYTQERKFKAEQTGEGICSVENCNLPIKGIGFCNRHYQLFKRHGAPEKLIKNSREHPLYITWFEKKQNKRLCEEWLVFKVFCEAVGERPEGNFVLNRPDRTKLYSPDNWEWLEKLKKEEDETDKDWWARKWKDARTRNPDLEYDRNLQRSFGIGLDEYLQKFQNQNGVCAICNLPETAVNGHSKIVRRLAVDHCHTTGKIRDLLCSRCNTTLGKLNEDLELLEKIKQYIIQHKEPE